MRSISSVVNNDKTKRLMIYDCSEGVYLFLFSEEKDGACYADLWFENVAEAKQYSHTTYQVDDHMWKEIPGPMEFCQHDWITPARIPGKSTGNPQWGKLEVLSNGIWIPVRRWVEENPENAGITIEEIEKNERLANRTK